MYSPSLGRFIQPDTLVPGAGNPQAFDRYAYVLGNPLRYIDPSGRTPACGFSYSDPECEKIPLKPKPPTPPPHTSDQAEAYLLSNLGMPTDGGNVVTQYGAPNTLDNNEDDLVEKGLMTVEDYLDKWGIHPGVDINKAESDNIYSVYDGVVVLVLSSEVNGGNKLIIEHNILGHKYYSIYFHLARLDVKKGYPVSKGDIIGLMGNSGTVKKHLHFEIRTFEGMGSQNSVVSFPMGANSWWANSSNELYTNWVDISSVLGGYDDFLPDDWR